MTTTVSKHKNDDLLTVKEVADLARCSLNPVYFAIRDGTLKANRVGLKKGYRIWRSEVYKWMARRDDNPFRA